MKEQANARILIVGCGQLGSRHLQAVASLSQVREVEVVDPRPEALALGRERLAEVPDRIHSTTFRWLSALEDASRGGDLCIVATQAQGRCQLVKESAETFGYKTFLLEKLVAQSIQEMEDLMAFARARELSAWVNCKTRAYPFHRRVKQRLDPGEPIIFSVFGGNQGLANNGIHNVDLFAFFDGADRIVSAGSHIDPMLHRTKRGTFDLSGTLHGSTEKGSHFTLSYASDHENSECLSVSTRRYRCIVDHQLRWAVEGEAASGWVWRPTPFTGNLAVSQMTKSFVTEILAAGRCELPTLEESLVSHRFILGELQPHFSRLLEREIDLCPVT